jgi:hypothetical protein
MKPFLSTRREPSAPSFAIAPCIEQHRKPIPSAAMLPEATSYDGDGTGLEVAELGDFPEQRRPFAQQGK